MKDNNQVQNGRPIGAILALCVTLNLFWVIVILKTAFSGFKSILNFHPPVGPLLGVYLLSIVIFIVSLSLFKNVKMPQLTAYRLLVISTIVYGVMLFPPVFEPIAHFIGS